MMNLVTTRDGKQVDFNYAEVVIKKLKDIKVGRYRKPYKISSSKLRTLLEPVNNLYTQVQHESSAQLSEKTLEELEYVKVRFMYESGREQTVKTFINESYLARMLDKVIKNGDKKSFIYFCRYFEALVAYAKYHRMEAR